MNECYSLHAGQPTIPIRALTQDDFPLWLAKQDVATQTWVRSSGFAALPDTLCFIPGKKHQLALVLLGVGMRDIFWHFGGLSQRLPKGIYQIDAIDELDELTYQHALLAFGLGSYQYDAYRSREPYPAKLFLPQDQQKTVLSWQSTAYLIRDLINTPTEDMGPAELAKAAMHIAKEGGATIKIIKGDDLKKEGFNAIHAVGRASHSLPCLIDICWGKKKDFKLTLIGKGVCFDTGGLDLKDASGMQLMKKDMGGAAHALGLARLIMQEKLPVYLRVLIPAVEDAIGSRSYRPGDVLSMQNGVSVEVTNTDAEGRLVLGDALVEAVREDPDLLVDFATLTGDARRALGPQVPVLFCNNDDMAEKLLLSAKKTRDPIWRLPLYHAYRDYLRSEIADITNSSRVPMAGAIVAALFLETFVPNQIPWIHLDLFAWNLESLPGRPVGGEMMTLRAIFYFLREHLKSR